MRLTARLLLPLLFWCTLPASAQQRLKVYISADMEGIAGVVGPEQIGPSGFEYGRFREFMTDEVVAAIEGARQAGATEFVIGDSHGNGLNLLIDRLPADVTVVRSWPRPLGMMEGIDSTFDAAILIGYHSGTANPQGVRAHTLSSARYTGVQLNGVEMPEAGISAAIAGHFGVPVALISGDDVAVSEAQQLIGPMEGAVVKRAIGFHSAATMTPEAARALIRDRTRDALRRLPQLRPFVLPAPIRLDVTFKHYRAAELLAYLPIVQRTTAHSIRFTGAGMPEIARFLEFIGNYEPNITP